MTLEEAFALPKDSTWIVCNSKTNAVLYAGPDEHLARLTASPDTTTFTPPNQTHNIT